MAAGAGGTTERAAALGLLCRRYEEVRAIRCPSCGAGRYYVISRGILRCASCGTGYRPFGRRAPINMIRLDYARWLSLAGSFARGESARAASARSGASYSTALLAYDVVRGSVGRAGRGAVYGVRERRGRAVVEPAGRAGSAALASGRLGAVQEGSLVVTGRWRGYDALVAHGYRREGRRWAPRGAARPGFAGFAVSWLSRYNGFGRGKLGLYLGEAAWRYNNRGGDLFSLAVDGLLGIG
ncbi:MAG: hypothetical protein MPJ08_02005 [Nitrosopumilus sp.]|nr:hypothetical protein [Nitrosopumilus sp.]